MISVEDFLKHPTLDIFSGSVAKNSFFFAIKRKKKLVHIGTLNRSLIIALRPSIQAVSGEKSSKKSPSKSHQVISHPSKRHLGQKHPETKCPPDTKSPQTICLPNQFALQNNLPYQEEVLVTEERLGLQIRSRSALHSEPVSGLGWGEPNFTSPYA